MTDCVIAFAQNGVALSFGHGVHKFELERAQLRLVRSIEGTQFAFVIGPQRVALTNRAERTIVAITEQEKT